MTRYRTCPDCGAHLDPDERCDCFADRGAETAASAAPSRNDSKRPAVQCPKNPAYLSVVEVAAHWNVGKDLVYALIRTGKLEAIRFGRTLRIPALALETYEAINRTAVPERAVKSVPAGRRKPVLRV